MESRTANLPPGVRAPFDVFVNGVRKEAGNDYEVRGGALVFREPLVQEGRLGIGAWLLGSFGIGTYKRNDEIDVRYEVDGQPRLAHALPLAGKDLGT